MSILQPAYRECLQIGNTKTFKKYIRGFVVITQVKKVLVRNSQGITRIETEVKESTLI